MTGPVNFLGARRIISVLRVAGLLVGLALLQACSAVKIAYDQAPTLAHLYLDGFMDFGDAQSVQVKVDLAKLQAWHRQTQLPDYIDLLQKTQPKMLQDITDKQACEIFADVRQKALGILDQAEPAALEIAATFTPRQLSAMERKFAKGNATWREDFLDGSAKNLAEKRQKSIIKRSEMLYGSVNSEQRSLIALQVDKSQFKAPLTYGERQRRQKDTLQTLAKITANPQDLNGTRREMRGLLNRSIASPDAAYRSYQERAIEDGCANFAELHNTTTGDQRKKAVRVLAGYEQDLKVLAAQK